MVTRLHLQRFCFAFLIVLPQYCGVGATENTLGQFEANGEVGSPKMAGSASYDAAGQSYTLAGAGTNMWFTTDQFHFLRRKMTGDFILRARMTSFTAGGDAHRKAGWMVRASLEADSVYADAAEHGNGLTELQFRRAPGNKTEEIKLPITNADVLQFERRGKDYIFSAARFGEPFVSATLTNFDLPDEVLAGLFICAHNGNRMETAVFDNLSIIRPAPENFVPYHDYIGSVLNIVDASTGHLEQIHRSDEPFEAPNWTHDGRALIYNISGRGAQAGRLCRFDLATRAPSLIDTEPAVKNNNDHVLSWDGAMLAMSGQAPDHPGSRIFTIPIAGGSARMVTPLAPSYCHGWSTDGKFLVFTGKRNDRLDIYKIPSDASADEIRLTDAGANDGSEYSPDGKYIYFTSSRTGLMQLWRMKPDGSEQEQVLNDEFNDWFPHLSPDGKWIAFLSFGKDIDPADHPYYKPVYLRLMPAAGGPARVIAYVYGGQGTMNVPSWSPDSRRLAFVSNSQTL